MQGYIFSINIDRNGYKYGLLSVDGDSNYYYFNNHDLLNCSIDQLMDGDPMEFEPVVHDGMRRRPRAQLVRKVDQVSIEQSKVKPGVNPSTHLDSFNADEKTIVNNCLGHVFQVTYGDQITINRSTYRYCFVKPTDFFQHAFNLSRELVVVFSDYVSFEPRDLDAASNIYESIREKLRLDRGCHILVCHDNDVEHKLVKILKDNNHNQIVIPFTYAELLSPHANSALIENRFKQYLFDVDLFAEIKPIQDDLFFFGRRDFVHDIVSKCKTGSNSGVFGLRRSGKTSLLFAVQRLLKQQSYPTVFIPCQFELRDLDWKTALYQVVSDIYKELKLSQANIDICNYSNDASATISFGKDMDSALLGIHMPLTLIFDEIEAITFGVNHDDGSENIWFDGEHYNKFWNTIKGYYSKHVEKLCILVAGTNPMINEEPTIGDTKLPNPMFGQLSASNQGAYLKAFSNEDTKNMVNTLGGYMGLSFDEYTISKLTEDCGGHPYLMRLLCSHINRFIKEAQYDRPITVTRAIYAKTISGFEKSQDAINFYLMILQILSTKYPKEYNALKILALQGDRVIGQTMDEKSLSHLLGYGLVERNKDNYAIRYDTIRNYLRGEFKFERVDLTIEEQQNEIMTRTIDVEKQLRKIVRNNLQWAMGMSKAKETVINSMSNHDNISDKDILRAQSLTYTQLFDPSVNTVFFLSVLKDIILEHFLLFQNTFEGATENQVRKVLSIINNARRCPSHSYPQDAANWTEKDFYDFREAMEWLEPILKQYE